jgi:hypothetical protein
MLCSTVAGLAAVCKKLLHVPRRPFEQLLKPLSPLALAAVVQAYDGLHNTRMHKHWSQALQRGQQLSSCARTLVAATLLLSSLSCTSAYSACGPQRAQDERAPVWQQRPSKVRQQRLFNK